MSEFEKATMRHPNDIDRIYGLLRNAKATTTRLGFTVDGSRAEEGGRRREWGRMYVGRGILTRMGDKVRRRK